MKLKNLAITVVLAAILGGCEADHSQPKVSDFDSSKGAEHCGDVYRYAALGGTQVFANGMSLEAYAKPLRKSDRRKVAAMMDEVASNHRGIIDIGNASFFAPSTAEDREMYEYMSEILLGLGEESVNSVANACLKKFSK